MGSSLHSLPDERTISKYYICHEANRTNDGEENGRSWAFEGEQWVEVTCPLLFRRPRRRPVRTLDGARRVLPASQLALRFPPSPNGHVRYRLQPHQVRPGPGCGL